jgi:hypothetical protein
LRAGETAVHATGAATNRHLNRDDIAWKTKKAWRFFGMLISINAVCTPPPFHSVSHLPGETHYARYRI